MWNAINSYDIREDGKIWEIYSGISNFTQKVDQDGGEEINEEGVVYKVLDDVGIHHQAGRCGIHDNVVVGLAELGYHLVQFAVAQQFGWVGRYGTGEDAVHAGADDVALDNAVPVVDLSGEVVGKACVFARVEVARQGAFTHVKVDNHGLLSGNTHASG